MWFFWVLGAACLIALFFAPALDKDLKHKRKADHQLAESEIHVASQDPYRFM